MHLLAQAETVVVQKALEELAKHGNSWTNLGPYVFVLVLCIICGGAFYVLRYMMGHTKEIHTEAHKSITGITERAHETIGRLSETFSSECRELREHSHHNISNARDMVHAARDLAQSVVSHKEFIAKMQEREGLLKKPEQGP